MSDGSFRDRLRSADDAARLVRDAGMAPVIMGDASTPARFDPGTPPWSSSMTAAQLRAALGLVGVVEGDAAEVVPRSCFTAPGR